MRRMLVSLIEQRKKHFFLELATYPLSKIFQVLVKLRNFLYNASLLTPEKTNHVVISIGNIVAGGVGKTPFVQLLARELARRAKVAIILRGYLGQASKKRGPQFVNLFSKSQAAAPYFGDEAIMLARKLPPIDIWIAPNRKKGVEEAAHRGAEIILLDDGFQHRRLHRDLDIVILDASRPVGSGYFLPRGPLRESPASLKRASFIGINNVQSEQQFSELCQWLVKYSCAKIFGMKTKLCLETITEKVAVLTAIGNPGRFLRALQERQIDVVHTLLLPDHSLFSEARLVGFINACHKKGAKKILCTEKDMVKLDRAFIGALPLEVVLLELEMCYNQNNFQDLIEQILEISYDKSRMYN